MKIFILVNIIILCFIGCSNKGLKSPMNDSRLTCFFESFDSLNFDYKIVEEDLYKFSDTIFDKNANLISNPKLKLFNSFELNLIKPKYQIDKRNKFYKLSKLKVNNNYLFSIVQINKEKTELWIKFITFNSNGELLDTLTFAGQKLYDHNVYGEISKENRIMTLAYYNIEPDSINLDNYYATEIKKVYTILNNGYFNLVEIKKERGYFTDSGTPRSVKRLN
jgi:hypothetical protein